VQGAASLLESVDLPALRNLFRIIEERHRLLTLLTAYIDSDGLTVVIGTEHPAPDLQHCSIVAARYWDGRRTGLVGVIGPTRMQYSRAIAAVDGVAAALNRVLLPQN
jgi:heat-inducible transcriptional repressor